MPRFAYTARDRAGKSVVADLEAPSRKDALRMLSARGLQVASVNELASARRARKLAATAPRKPAARRARRASRRASVQTLTSPRMPAVSRSTLRSRHAAASRRARRCVCSRSGSRSRGCAPSAPAFGSKSAKARRFRARWRVFRRSSTPSITNLIQAGEATGSLNDTLARLIAHLTEQASCGGNSSPPWRIRSSWSWSSCGVILFFLRSCCRA